MDSSHCASAHPHSAPYPPHSAPRRTAAFSPASAAHRPPLSGPCLPPELPLPGNPPFPSLNTPCRLFRPFPPRFCPSRHRHWQPAPPHSPPDSPLASLWPPGSYLPHPLCIHGSVTLSSSPQIGPQNSSLNCPNSAPTCAPLLSLLSCYYCPSAGDADFRLLHLMSSNVPLKCDEMWPCVQLASFPLYLFVYRAVL